MSTLQIASIGVLMTLCIFSFLLNGICLIVIRKSWRLLKQRRITYHVTNVATSDCIVGASAICEFISIAVEGRATWLRLLFGNIAWVSILTSLLGVCLMAIERAVCVKKPLSWKQILPLKRIILVMVGNWVLALALVILMQFYTFTTMFVFIVLFYAIVLVTSAVYINMYIAIRMKSSRQVVPQGEATEQNSSATMEERRNNIMQRKAGNLVLILTLVLLTTVSPAYFTLGIVASCEVFKLNCKFMATLNNLITYFYLLSITNHVVNPIIYVWRVSLYRRAFWHGIFRRADTSITTENTQNSSIHNR